MERIIGCSDFDYSSSIKGRIYKVVLNEPELCDNNCPIYGETIIREHRIICLPAYRPKLERGWGHYVKPIKAKAAKLKKEKQIKRPRRKKLSNEEMFGLLYLQQLESERRMFIALRGW